MTPGRTFLVVVSLVAVLAGCSSSTTDDTLTPESTTESPPEIFVDERLETEPFAHSAKVDICTQVSELAESSEVLEGRPHMDVVEEDEWFCRIDGIDWVTNPVAATIELGFREYTDEELQQLRDDVAEEQKPYSACGLITFYDGHVSLSEVSQSVEYCEQQTTLADTTYFVRNATAITIKLQLEGSPEEHSMSSLDRDNFTLRTDIIEFIDQYTP